LLAVSSSAPLGASVVSQGREPLGIDPHQGFSPGWGGRHTSVQILSPLPPEVVCHSHCLGVFLYATRRGQRHRSHARVAKLLAAHRNRVAPKDIRHECFRMAYVQFFQRRLRSLTLPVRHGIIHCVAKSSGCSRSLPSSPKGVIRVSIAPVKLRFFGDRRGRPREGPAGAARFNVLKAQAR
jgi:hypothetical protein